MSKQEEKPGTRSVEVEIEIAASLEAVWKALTEAEEITRWFAPQAKVTPGEGGTIQWSWGEFFDWESRIERWEPKRFLRAVYTAPPHTGAAAESGGPALPLAMDFVLGTREGKTVLRLVHSGFGSSKPWDEEYDGVRRGWGVELRSLRHYLENHRGRDRALAWVRRDIPIPYEEAWERLVGPNGLARSGSVANLREGGRYSTVAATGDRFEGSVIVYGPPQDFAGTVENMNNAFLRLGLEKCAGSRQVWFWLETYDLPAAEVDSFRYRWQNLLGKLFPET